MVFLLLWVYTNWTYFPKFLSFPVSAQIPPHIQEFENKNYESKFVGVNLFSKFWTILGYFSRFNPGILTYVVFDTGNENYKEIHGYLTVGSTHRDKRKNFTQASSLNCSRKEAICELEVYLNFLYLWRNLPGYEGCNHRVLLYVLRCQYMSQLSHEPSYNLNVRWFVLIANIRSNL